MTGRALGILAVVGSLGWAGLIWIAIQLYGTVPRTSAFDLDLLIGAGRAVAAGHTPYDPAMLAGTAPVAERLFYSYPPVVAQVMALISWIPSPTLFVAWDAAAVAGLMVVTARLADRLAPDRSAASVVLPMLALTPLLFPFAVGLLFGNLDVFFPLLYGLMLLAVLPTAVSRDAAAGGASSATAAVTKLHPASMTLWFLVRARRPGSARRAVLTALAVGVAILAVSLAVGGPQPWLDYAAVVRAGSGADLVDPRNGGPAAQIALLVGGGGPSAEALARTLQVPVVLIAVGATVVAAWRVRDAVESLAWAAAASLVVLPVTWYHYPSALIPFAIAAVLRAKGSHASGSHASGRRVPALVAGAAVVALIGISWLPLLYLSAGLVLLAVRESREGGESQERRESPAAAVTA